MALDAASWAQSQVQPRCHCRENTVTAHLISPAKGAHFSMYLARMSKGATAPAPAPGVERWVRADTLASDRTPALPWLVVRRTFFG